MVSSSAFSATGINWVRCITRPSKHAETGGSGPPPAFAEGESGSGGFSWPIALLARTVRAVQWSAPGPQRHLVAELDHNRPHDSGDAANALHSSLTTCVAGSVRSTFERPGPSGRQTLSRKPAAAGG